MLTDTCYDAAGRVTLTNTGYYTPTVNPSGGLFTPGTTLPGAVQTSFDGGGRPTASIQMIDGIEAFRATIGYKGADETDTIPPAGGTPTSTFTNSIGKTAEIVQYLSADLTGPQEATAYGYDSVGHMTSITDQAGERWSWTYNPLGQQVSAVDPDSGTTTMNYDADGNIVSTTDADGHTLSYNYDHLGRKTIETDATGTELASWSYDPTLGGAQYKGQLGSLTAYVGGSPTTLGAAYTSAVTGYDADYRPLGTAFTVPATVASQFGLPTSGASYTSTTSYNVDGSAARTVEPAAGGLPADALSYFYTPLGHLYSLGGPGIGVVGDTTFTHTNQIAQLDLTNGTTEVDRTYTYQDGTNRLTNLLTTTSAATNIHPSTDTYSYNNAGEITSDGNTADGVATDTQCYSYDYQQNLNAAWTPASNSCTAVPSSSTLGGPSPYWTSYTVDPTTGNRTQTIEHATTGIGTDTLDTYTYPAATAPPSGGNGGGNAVKEVAHATAPAGTNPTTTGAWTAAGDDKYTYTLNGSTATMPGQSLHYNTAGQQDTTTVTTGANSGNTQNDVYDASGNLIYQSDPVTGSTLYFGDTHLHVGGGGVATGVRTYSDGTTPVGERSTNPAGASTFNWLCANSQGTSTIEINATTLVATRRYEDPFGRPRPGASTTWSSANDFLNAASNPFAGTTQLGARSYSPAIGRFLTTDPLLNPADPNSINGYAYANNNPATYSDPSGAHLCDDPNCGAGTAKSWNSGQTRSVGPEGGGSDDGSSSPTAPGSGGESAVVISPHVAISLANPNASKLKSAFDSFVYSHNIGNLFEYKFPAGEQSIEAQAWMEVCRENNDLCGPRLTMQTLAIGLGLSGSIFEPSVITGCGQSFRADTQVRMGSGDALAISDLRPGDQILAEDVSNHKVRVEEVDAVYLREEAGQVVVQVANRDGKRASIHTTGTHPFWDPQKRRWVPAARLRRGERLESVSGLPIDVVNVLPRAGFDSMWDLTVEDLHDFFVVTGSGDVLVHNCSVQLQNAQLWTGKFPVRGGPADGVLVRRNADGDPTNYAEYDAAGIILKRVDLTGRAHGGVETPHTLEYEHDEAPDGTIYPRPGRTVRSATPDEIPDLSGNDVNVDGD